MKKVTYFTRLGGCQQGMKGTVAGAVARPDYNQACKARVRKALAATSSKEPVTASKAHRALEHS